MCGILGYIALGKERPKFEEFEEAFVKCQNRGRDATGFYTKETGIVKKDIKAEDFVKEFKDSLKKGLSSNIMLAHCRAMTKGDPKNNVNNHPHESENYILIHNGVISRTDPIENFKLRSECDSEVILSYIETHGIKKGLEEMLDDSMAIAILDKRTNLVYLYRNTNPTNICIDKKKKIIYFGSTSEITKSFYRYGNTFGFNVWDDIIGFETEKNLLYTISVEKGVILKESIEHKKWVYKPHHHNNAYNYRDEYTGYHKHTRSTYCNKCGRSVEAGNHSCSSSDTPFSRRGIERKLIYRNGSPKVIIADSKIIA